MDKCMHKTMASIASWEKIEIIRSQEFMPSKVRLKFLKKKMIILGPKTAILGPQFCRILVLGPQFWWLGGSGPRAPWICPWDHQSNLDGPFVCMPDIRRLPVNIVGVALHFLMYSQTCLEGTLYKFYQIVHIRQVSHQ